MRNYGVIAGCVASALFVGALAPNVKGAARPDSGIAAAIEGARAALQRGDARALASYYTPDAELEGSIGSLHGREAIERHMAEIIGQGIHDVKFEEQEVFPGADFTVETGRSLVFDRAGTRVAVLRYMTLWKKESDGFRVHRDVSFPVAIDADAVARMAAGNAGFSIKEVPAFQAVVLPMRGSYKQHGEAIGRLGLWLGSAKVQPIGSPFGRYHNSPDRVRESDLAWEVGFPVPDGTTAEAPFEIRTIDDQMVLSAVIGGPTDTTPRPWPQVAGWAERNGYTITGEPMEIWTNGTQTEMRIAVRK